MKPEDRAVASVSRSYSAAPERVYDAWLDPVKVRVWWNASAAAAGRGASETLERVRIEPHIGGSFSFLVRRDGKLIDHTGTYQELDRPRRLVFTWTALDVDAGQEIGQVANDDSPDFSRVVIEIKPTPTGCDVTLIHEMHPDWTEFVERAAKAWSFMLDGIAELLSEQGEPSGQTP